VGVLRLLLALSVVGTHAGRFLSISLPDGDYAVRVFFIISGFYMALILNEKYTGPGSYRVFITNRFVRIYSLYFLIVCLTAILALGIHTDVRLFDADRLAHLDLGAKAFLFITNFGLLGADLGAFVRTDNGTLEILHQGVTRAATLETMSLVPQAWTLSMELVFYFMAPFLVRQVGRLVTIGALSVALHIALLREGFTSPAWTHEFFPTELAFFIAGALLFHARRADIYRRWAPKLSPKAPYLAIFAFAGFGDLPSLVCYALIAISIPFLFDWTARNSIDRLIGELSYPLYLCHFLVIFAVRASIPGVMASGRFGDICTFLSLAFAVGLYWLVVVPIDRWRAQRVGTALHPAPQPA
jgi:peptidoglycan/LPS O-acetylase OafA/YrhL